MFRVEGLWALGVKGSGLKDRGFTVFGMGVQGFEL